MRKLLIPLFVFVLFGCSKETVIDTIDESKTEKIESLSSRVLPNGLVVCPGPGYYYNDDMLFKPEYVDQIEQAPTRGFSLSAVNSYWPNRTVYYSFDSSVKSSLRTSILGVMNEISDSSGVIFKAKTSTTKNYVVFKNAHSGKSASEVGMQGGEQDIIIVTPNYNNTTIHHEIFHTLGFYHEHQRSDRNNYIIVNYDLIPSNLRHNFDIVAGTNIGPYDLSSIMHYGSLSNPSSENEALVCYLTGLNGEILPSSHLHMSAGDIQSLRAIYGPPFHRLENVTTIYRDIVAGADEVYDAYTETYLRFYADESCTTRMSLSYPRTIVIRSFESNCTPSSNGNVKSKESFRTYIIPAGVDSFLIDSRRNYEHYFMSDGYSIDSKYYSLSSPRHLPDIELIDD
jgi:hypothetical protein